MIARDLRLAGVAALLALPLLAGSFPEECAPPSAGDIAFEATVTSVEHRGYACDPQDLELPTRRSCLEIFASPGMCSSHEVTLHAPDGTARTARLGSGVGVSWCDLPAGRSTIAICTDAGTLDCAIDLRGDDSSVQLALHSSLPYHHRYRVHAGAVVPGLGGPDLTLDSDILLDRGARRLFVVARARRDAIPVVGRCGAREVTRPAVLETAHGCAHCSASDGDRDGIVLVGIALALLRRPR